jgi:predicted amidohydrolase YtcJ
MRMGVFNRAFLTSLFSLVLAVGCSSMPRVSPADLVLTGGRVFTGDPARSWASALAISEEELVAVGTDEEIRRYIGPATRSIALEGRVVIPGIHDALVRLEWEPAGVFIEIPPDASVEVLLNLVRDATIRAPSGSWIRGELPAALFEAVLGRTHLDIAAPLHPVRLDLGGDGALLNSSALLAWGIADGDKDPVDGRFGRTVTGALDGWVFGSPLRAAARRTAGKISDQAILDAIRELEQRALRLGVTSVQIVSEVPVDRLESLLGEAGLVVRWRVLESELVEGSEGTRRASRMIVDGSGTLRALGSGGSIDPWRKVMLATMSTANSQETLTREEAIAAHTRGSPLDEIEEMRKGTLGAGMVADFAVLSQDVFAVAPEALPKTRSELTVVGGEVVWEEGGEGGR